MVQVERINQIIKEKNLNWVAGLNSIAILSDWEKRRLCGLLPSTKEQKEKYPPISLKKFALPSSFDWRNKDGKNWVTPIKDQGQCGSCWAFATCGSIESKVKIMRNQPNLNIDLSEQQLVSCCDIANGYEADGCNGSNGVTPPFQYAKDVGIVDENCFLYAASKILCSPCNDWRNRVIKINTFQTYSNDSLKDSLVLYGPTAIGMEVREDFMYYNGGIYKPTTTEVLGFHAVILIGYNDNERYWILKNSWGTDWGEDGWFRMSYDAEELIQDGDSTSDNEEIPIGGGISPLLMFAPLLLIPMINYKKDKDLKIKMAEEKESKAGITGVVILGVLAIAGIVAYFLLKPPTPPTPPGGEVSADITEFTITVS